MKRLISLLTLICIMITGFCFASCGDESTASSEALTKAHDYIQMMYKDNAEETPADYQVVSVVIIDGTSYKVEWSVDVTEGVTLSDDGKLTTVDVDEKAAQDIKYVLKGKISDSDGNSTEISFSHKVPAFAEIDFEKFLETADDTAVVVKGVVTGVISVKRGNTKNCLYIQDDTGAYYAYGMTDDPEDLGIKEGMTVRVSGTKDTYNGTLEITTPSVEILDSSIKTVEAKDYTELYKAASTLKDTSLVKFQGLLVTLKGVEITGEDESSGYYKFKLGNLESYIRISSSVCPMSSADIASFKEGHASHLGWTANATGLISLYSGAFYLTPVTKDAFEYLSAGTKTDAEKVAFEKEALTLTGEVTASGDIDVSVAGKSYTDVAISWASDNAAVVADGAKLKVTMPADDASVKITATLKCGTATDTKEFALKLTAKAKTYTVAEAIAAMASYASGQLSDSQCTVTGVVTASSYNSTYKSYTIWLKNGDTEKAFELYSAVCADGVDKESYHTENALLGCTVTCTGYLQKYNDIYEIGYLNKTKSPTGVATSPVISSITMP